MAESPFFAIAMTIFPPNRRLTLAFKVIRVFQAPIPAILDLPRFLTF
jgi:hypothetical protein